MARMTAADAPKRRLLALDGAAAVGFSVLPWLAGVSHAGGVAWALALGAGLPLAVRRLWPVPVLCVVVLDACVATPLRLGPTSLLAAAYAAYTVSVSRSRRMRASALAVGSIAGLGAAGLMMAGARNASGDTYPSRLTLGLVVVCAAWTAGGVVRERREAARRLLEQVVARSKVEERLQLARDIHDVVTHSVGIIAVKASVANHVAGAHPDEALQALVEIEQISRKALGDLRTTLRELRSQDEAVNGANAPGLADLLPVISGAEAAGVRVEFQTDLATRPPDAVGLSAFRIVQEALTNVVKHAAPTDCRVAIAADHRAMTVEVCDDGPGPGHRTHSLSGGLGIVGMQERVAAHGGSLTVGPRAEGGYAVRAELPY